MATVKTVEDVQNEVCDSDSLGTSDQRSWVRLLVRAMDAGDAAQLRRLLATECAAGPDAVLSPDGDTALMHACRLDPDAVDAGEVVSTLLEAGAEPNRRDCSERSALHHAAYTSNDVALALLLEHKATDINAVDDEGSTALHFTAAPSWTIRNRERHLRCIRLLVREPRFEVNRPDGLGQTAIATAVQLHYDDRIKVMLEEGAGRVNVDYSRAVNGRLVRDAIAARFPQLRRLLPAPHEEDPACGDPQRRLLAAMQQRDVDTFFQLLQLQDSDKGCRSVDPNHVYGDPYYSTCLEMACRRRGDEEFVRALLQGGADPDTRNEFSGVPVVQQAVENGCVAALEVLLGEGGAQPGARDPASHTALHVAAQRQCSTRADTRDVVRCVSLLLDCDGTLGPGPGAAVDVDAQDQFGDTALHDAAPLLRNQEGEPPLAFIDAGTLRAFLDEQLQSNGLSPQGDDYQLIFKYDFLRGRPSLPGKTPREMEPLVYMSRSESLRALLTHPVLTAFLLLKWHTVRAFYYVNLAAYTAFALLMTAYIVLLTGGAVDDRVMRCIFNKSCLSAVLSHIAPVGVLAVKSAANVTAAPPAVVVETTASSPPNDTEVELVRNVYLALVIISVLIGPLMAALVARELVQLVSSPRRYVAQAENYLELVVLVCSAATLCNGSLSIYAERHLCAITVLLIWTELIVMTGKLPYLSMQLEMLKKVTGTFARFMAWYSLLIAAFALSFYTMFHEDGGDGAGGDGDAFFRAPGLTLVRTVGMLAGEFEMSSIPFHLAPGTSHVVFVVFVLLVTIVLLNLLNGLAVSDTNAIREDASVLSLVTMVQLIAFYEETLHKLGSRCHLPEFATKFIRRRHTIFDPDLPHRQVHAFPASREVKFLLDAETTEWFSSYRASRDVLHAAAALVTEVHEAGDANQQVADKVAACERSVQSVVQAQRDMARLLRQAVATMQEMRRRGLHDDSD
ncbi:transient receptor potential channel pyrexia-like [Schistocerca piceifrons]|uniref:transient receptor potential channel pyrexia-like n=1 Tax=Schistocerca piceifrons TaxID=274613 RepID=UPI001F5E7262|nr:transient receptor potential channel pyrexia-like [Schistocerca piceifrons]